MAKLKEFLRQHLILVGLMAVALPLGAHLWLQYQSLSQLQATMPHARKAYMRKYLSIVIDKVVMFYQERANQVLALPPGAFHHKYPNPDYDPMKAMDLPQIADHFRKNQFKGARLLFAGIISGPKDPNYILIRFYDPVSCSYIRGTKREWAAAHAAAANWMAMIMANTAPASLRPTVDERDPKNRVIVKPIVDEKSKVLGVAGMVLNDYVFINDYLAPTIKSTLPASFPEEYSDVIVTLQNYQDELLYANQKFEGKTYEVGWPFPFIYSDWFLGIRQRNMTEEQWSQRHFLTNLSFSILTALVLLGGIILTLRTVSRAMKLSQMKADFVSNVSHELRTPLASIRVFGEFLKLGRIRDDRKIHEYGEYIETESRRLTQLINNILDFSKIESGQKTYDFQEADVELIVSDTIKTFEVILEQQGFSINYEKPQMHMPLAIIDPDAIAQALINLIDNAVKYSGDAKEIDVKLGYDDGFISISVTDYGIGISREDYEKVFDKFYRVGNSLVHDVKGSGLGLSIVKHIVEAHEGKTSIESEVGRGSTFTISLPAGITPVDGLRIGRRDLSKTGSALGQSVTADGHSGD